MRETPPHPLPRALMWLTAAVVVVAVLWATFGRVDIITTADGKIIPGGRVKVIQSFDRGVVQRIAVTEGQFVKTGDALVELDQTQSLADRARVASELDFTVRRLARRETLEKLLAAGADSSAAAKSLEDATAALSHPEDRRLLREDWRRLATEQEALDAQLAERRAELGTVRKLIQRHTALTELSRERRELYEPIHKKGHVSQIEYLAVREEGVQRSHELEVEKAREEQLLQSIAGVEKQCEALRAKNLATVLAEIEELARQKESLTQELAKYTDVQAKQILESPVDGAVKGLMVHTIGGVVNPAETLMEVVPLGERLEVEVFIGNQDIGYVHAGQTAEVKIHTFPFTKYGVIPATVEAVAHDATVDEKLGLIYRARLTLEKNGLMVDGTPTPLLPGMGVTAEIATGRRRLIEFFLAPLLRAKQESLRER